MFGYESVNAFMSRKCRVKAAGFAASIMQAKEKYKVLYGNISIHTSRTRERGCATDSTTPPVVQCTAYLSTSLKVQPGVNPSLLFFPLLLSVYSKM